MYLDHFGLRENPFSITPHTEFFFSGANRGATLEALIYAITHDEGIVKVSGEVGSGKTMLCRMLLEKLPKQVETVYLANPSLSREDILQAIAEELGIQLTAPRAHQMMRLLQERLLEIHTAGHQVVVMIDEAHAMPAETLEEIRLLSNLETNRHKLLHIVLFGQPELNERLSQQDMRQLKDRITHNFTLEPLHRNDIGNYLMFRLRAAGYRGPDLFTVEAIQHISKASQGLTRRINILADKALLSAFSEDQHLINGRLIKIAARDAQFTPMRSHSPSYALQIGAALSTVIILAATTWWFGKPANMPSVEKSDSTTLTADSSPIQSSAGNGGSPAISSPTPETLTASATQPTPAEPPENHPATSPEAENKPPMAAALTPEVETASAATPKTTSSPDTWTLAERIAATAEWLKTAPDTHYFIQLLSTDGSNVQGVERFLDRTAKALDPQHIRVYRSDLSGHDRLGAIYGDYPTREAAHSELARLVKTIPAGNPYIRSVSKLK